LTIDLVRTTKDDAPRLSRLMQLYAYDFSEFMGWDVGDDALFDVGDALTRCWSEPSRHVFWCQADGHRAGFVILDERSRLTGDPDVVDVAEFFVMRKYRRTGIGAACAARAFDLFPRKWEVREQANNIAATAFWRRTIHEYTRGRFEETLWENEHGRGVVQSFDARALPKGDALETQPPRPPT
jgi:predicted acetyltransferase